MASREELERCRELLAREKQRGLAWLVFLKSWPDQQVTVTATSYADAKAQGAALLGTVPDLVEANPQIRRNPRPDAFEFEHGFPYDSPRAEGGRVAHAAALAGYYAGTDEREGTPRRYYDIRMQRPAWVTEDRVPLWEQEFARAYHRALDERGLAVQRIGLDELRVVRKNPRAVGFRSLLREIPNAQPRQAMFVRWHAGEDRRLPTYAPLVFRDGFNLSIQPSAEVDGRWNVAAWQGQGAMLRDLPGFPDDHGMTYAHMNDQEVQVVVDATVAAHGRPVRQNPQLLAVVGAAGLGALGNPPRFQRGDLVQRTDDDGRPMGAVLRVEAIYPAEPAGGRNLWAIPERALLSFVTGKRVGSRGIEEPTSGLVHAARSNPCPLTKAQQRAAGKLMGNPARYSHAARAFMEHKVPLLIAEGYPPKQAVAIAFNMARQQGLKVPGQKTARMKKKNAPTASKGGKLGPRPRVSGSADLSQIEDAFAPADVKRAQKRYRMFHGVDADQATVFRVDDGKPGVTRHLVVGLGETPQTSYQVPWDGSTKEDHVWVHDHPDDNRPLKVIDPKTNVVSDLPTHPRARVDDFFRD